MGRYNPYSSNPYERYQASLESGNYQGSSGYWGDTGQYGGARQGYGYPGDTSRNSLASQQGLTSQAAGTSPYSWGSGANSNAWRQSNSNPSNQFQTLNNVKNQSFQNSVNSGLTDLTNSAFGANTNPYVLRTNTKDQILQNATNGLTENYGNYINPTDFTKSGQFQGGINSGYSQAGADKQANRDQFANFNSLFNAQSPGVANNVTQENNAIGQVYNGGLQSTLDAQAAARGRAVNQSAQFALGRVNQANSLASMVGGNSSYLNKQMLDSAAQIRANEAIQQSDLARSNTQYVLGQQASLNGVRNRNNDYLSNRQMVPVQYLQQLGNSEDSRLAGLGSMDLSNNIYTTPSEQGSQRASMLSALSNINNSNNFYQTDSAQQDLARRTAILAQLQGVNNQNNFYGLQTPYQPDYSGYSTNFGGGQNYGRNNNGYYNGAGYQVNNASVGGGGGGNGLASNTAAPAANWGQQAYNPNNYASEPLDGGYYNLNSGNFYPYGTPAVNGPSPSRGSPNPYGNAAPYLDQSNPYWGSYA